MSNPAEGLTTQPCVNGAQDYAFVISGPRSDEPARAILILLGMLSANEGIIVRTSRISERLVFIVWAVCSFLWTLLWLLYLPIQGDPELASNPLLEEEVLAVVFGVPMLAGLVLWAFFRARRWLARSARRRRKEIAA